MNTLPLQVTRPVPFFVDAIAGALVLLALLWAMFALWPYDAPTAFPRDPAGAAPAITAPTEAPDTSAASDRQWASVWEAGFESAPVATAPAAARSANFRPEMPAEEMLQLG